MSLISFKYPFFFRFDHLPFYLFIAAFPFYLFYFLNAYLPSKQTWLLDGSALLYAELVFQQRMGFGMLALLLLATLLATKYKNQLQEEKDSYLHALDQAALSIAILDADKRVKWTNNMFETWNGKTEVLHQNFLDLTTNRTAAAQAFDQLSQSDQWKQEYQSQTLKGKAVKTTINKLKVPKGNYVVMDADISDLLEANRYQQFFTALIGHDTQSHAKKSLKKVNALYQQYQQNPALKEALGSLVEEVEHTFDLTRNLTDWGELLIKRKEPIHSSYIVFADQMEEVEERYTTFIQYHQIDFIKDYDDGLSLWVDPIALRAILRNLISNALSAILKRIAVSAQPRGTVKISAEKDETTFWTKISVSDNGRGLTSELAKNLFRPTPQEEAVSLGTMICRKFVQAHNGEIFVDEAVEGFITTITFTIPPKKKQM